MNEKEFKDHLFNEKVKLVHSHFGSKYSQSINRLNVKSWNTNTDKKENTKIRKQVDDLLILMNRNKRLDCNDL